MGVDATGRILQITLNDNTIVPYLNNTYAPFGCLLLLLLLLIIILFPVSFDFWFLSFFSFFLCSVKDPALAMKLAIKFNLPGADDSFKQQFTQLLAVCFGKPVSRVPLPSCSPFSLSSSFFPLSLSHIILLLLHLPSVVSVFVFFSFLFLSLLSSSQVKLLQQPSSPQKLLKAFFVHKKLWLPLLLYLLVLMASILSRNISVCYSPKAN